MWVYHENQTEQIEMLILKNICFYTCISHPVTVLRDNPQNNNNNKCYYHYFLTYLLIYFAIFVVHVKPVWRAGVSFAAVQLSNQAVEGIISLGDDTSSIKRL